jgi:hypothetical protein
MAAAALGRCRDVRGCDAMGRGSEALVSSSGGGCVWNLTQWIQKQVDV